MTGNPNEPDLSKAHAALAGAKSAIAEKNRLLAFEQLLAAKAAAGLDRDTLKETAVLLIEISECSTAAEVLQMILQQSPSDFPIRVLLIDARSRYVQVSMHSALAFLLHDILNEPGFPADLLAQASFIFSRLRDLRGALAASMRVLDGAADPAAAALRVLHLHVQNVEWQNSPYKMFRTRAVNIPAKQTAAVIQRAAACGQIRPETLISLAKTVHTLGFSAQALAFAERAYTARADVASSIHYSYYLCLAGQYEDALTVLAPQLDKIGKWIATETVLIAAEVLIACKRPDLEAGLIERVAQERPTDKRLQAASWRRQGT